MVLLDVERQYEAYLGDGAYVFFSGFGEVILYTSNGITETNVVVLGPYEIQAFDSWRAQLAAELNKSLSTAASSTESEDPSDAQSGPTAPSQDGS